MAYQAPVGKNGVYFTKNLNKQNYDTGIDLLGYYFRNSIISHPPYAPFTNFDGMVMFLRNNYPTYIEALGDLSKSINRDVLIQAMKNAAARGLTDYPRPSYFNNEIMKLSGVSIGSVVSETISEIGDSLVLGSRVLLTIMVAGGLALAYLYARPYFPKELKGGA